eukprot:8258799-Pyramimonas_sp.AAC.1
MSSTTFNTRALGQWITTASMGASKMSFIKLVAKAQPAMIPCPAWMMPEKICPSGAAWGPGT